jgi:hypothetical protein
MFWQRLRSVLASSMTAGPVLLAFATGVSAQCVSPATWHTKADAEFLINRTGARFLLEYRVRGGNVEGAPFRTNLVVEPGIYRLRSRIEAGNASGDFAVWMVGAVDAQSGEQISISVQRNKTKKLDRRVRVERTNVEFNVRSESVGKTWSIIGPTTLCKIK